MALSQEFEEDELADVKERFFREAETAGRLNHPNIVTMYDAGEEHDLAYIAMEFLKGKDLVPRPSRASLLPLPKVMEHRRPGRRGAGLRPRQQRRASRHQAGQHHVRTGIRSGQGDRLRHRPHHRFVKTKTGMVLGTPSYMSPEQLAGKKIDGRSDLFSLGVMLLPAGVRQLPFEGDSMAQLMFKIANEPHPDIRRLGLAWLSFSCAIPSALSRSRHSTSWTTTFTTRACA
jgi:serine/threonine protein kinase